MNYQEKPFNSENLGIMPTINANFTVLAISLDSVTWSESGIIWKQNKQLVNNNEIYWSVVIIKERKICCIEKLHPFTEKSALYSHYIEIWLIIIK